MGGALRSGLLELADVFGCSLVEAAPETVASVPEVAADVPSGETTLAVMPPAGDTSTTVPLTPEQEFVGRVSIALSSLRGRSYPASGTATLTVIGIKRPQVHRPKRKHLDLMVPLVVSYEGRIPPEDWAAADKAMEKDVLETLKANASGPFKNLRFLRRKKSDPFSGEPESLTILRFRA